MTNFPLDRQLSAAQLKATQTLPLKPTGFEAAGRFVLLLPFDAQRDTPALFAASDGSDVTIGEHHAPAYDADALVWRYLFKGPFESASELGAFLTEIAETPNFRAFTVLEASSRQPAGFAAYTNNTPEHLKIELGHIWYSPAVQGSKANLETTYLLLGRAFALGYRRVEWKCDALNARSRRSALRMGFRFEAIQEAHFIVKGRNRDTAWFRMLDSEWPDEKERLEAMLYG